MLDLATRILQLQMLGVATTYEVGTRSIGLSDARVKGEMQRNPDETKGTAGRTHPAMRRCYQRLLLRSCPDNGDEFFRKREVQVARSHARAMFFFPTLAPVSFRRARKTISVAKMTSELAKVG